MNILKEQESIVIQAASYFLENVGSNDVVINIQGQGFDFFSSDNLHVIKRIRINQVVHPYTIFIKSDGTEIMSYDADQNRMVHVLLSTEGSYPIDIQLISAVISPSYYWYDHLFICMTYSYDFYLFDNKEKKTVFLSDEDCKRLLPEYHKFSQHVISDRYDLVAQVNAYQGSFIGVENRKVIFYDKIYCARATVENPSLDYYDVLYYYGTFIFVSEDALLIVRHGNTYLLTPNKNRQRFLKICFVLDQTGALFIALEADHFDDPVVQLVKYRIIA